MKGGEGASDGRVYFLSLRATIPFSERPTLVAFFFFFCFCYFAA